MQPQHAVNETRIEIAGTLDALNATQMRGTIDELVNGRCGLVVVDASSLEFIDSCGLAVLVSLLKRMRTRGGNMVIGGLNGQPLVLFKLLSLYRVFVPKVARARPYPRRAGLA